MLQKRDDKSYFLIEKYTLVVLIIFLLSTVERENWLSYALSIDLNGGFVTQEEIITQ